MANKKIEPKNPETTSQKTDPTRDAERKNQLFKVGGHRKLARKSSVFKGGTH